MQIHSYSSIFNIGHKAIQMLFASPVIVEEKVDGSQFSMGVSLEGELMVRSKGATLHPDAPEKMFTEAVATAQKLKGRMLPGYVYRGEYLKKPKHNTLAYNRVPQDHIILFDVETPSGDFLDPVIKSEEGKRLDLEVVPSLYTGMISEPVFLRSFLDRESVLGGQKIEGVVIKPLLYNLWGPDHKVLMGKFVSEAFKEIHQGDWKERNPGRGDILQILIDKYKTPARWAKAVQHLKEQGKITSSLKDIGALIHETHADVLKEEVEAIKQSLMSYFWDDIKRGVTSGLPQWYKEQLLKEQFENPPTP